MTLSMKSRAAMRAVQVLALGWHFAFDVNAFSFQDPFARCLEPQPVLAQSTNFSSQAHLTLTKNPLAVRGKTAQIESSNIRVLSRLIAQLDPLRDLLAKTLDGWEIPQIVVIGGESSGKSSILERLAMMPLLPRAEKFCTRLPIQIRLRRSHKVESFLEVRNVKTGELEKTYPISTENAEIQVQEEMDTLVANCSDNQFGLSSKWMIALHISKPDLPNIDLVDLPGIVTVPESKAAKTRSILKTYLERSTGNLLFLCIVKATEDLTQSVALEMIEDGLLTDQTMGVFTFCDHLNNKTFKMLRERLAQKPCDQPVQLNKYGWVATSNSQPEGDFGSSSERLHQQARDEQNFFQQSGMQDLMLSGKASTDALVDRLHVMYTQNLMETWMPQTVALFEDGLRRCAADNALLGLPAATAADVDAIRPRAVRCAASLLMQEGGLHGFSRTCNEKVLTPLRNYILEQPFASRELLISAWKVCQELSKWSAWCNEHCKAAATAMRKCWVQKVAARLREPQELNEFHTEPVEDASEGERSTACPGPFQLGRFPLYIDRITAHVDKLAKSCLDAALTKAEHHVAQFFSPLSPWVHYQLPDEYVSGRGTCELQAAALTTAIVVQFAGANEEIATRLEKDLENQLEGVADATPIPGDMWTESCAERRRELAERQANLTEVFDKMMEALFTLDDTPENTLSRILRMFDLCSHHTSAASCMRELERFIAHHPTLIHEENDAKQIDSAKNASKLRTIFSP